MRRDGPMKFEKDFDFESANAQFNKEEIDKEFQSKLKLKGSAKDSDYTVNSCFHCAHIQTKFWCTSHLWPSLNHITVYRFCEM